MLAYTLCTHLCPLPAKQALRLGMGGSAVGPAGTGKTETIRDFGRCLGRFVLVLNCSQEMGVEAVARLLRGAASAGAWVDFDEFNRIPVEVLSVAASQIHCTLTAMRGQMTKFVFTDGRLCKMEAATVGLFTTMNPG